MRVSAGGISVRAIPGSRSVLFGFDASESAREGLLGFTIGRKDSCNGDVKWLRGFKFFEQTEPSPEPGTRRSTRDHPIQSFQWGDYKATPDSKTDYVVQGVYGEPDDLSYGPELELSVTTGNAENDEHGVYFNRGVIPSQAFADEFGNRGLRIEEQNDPDNEKVKWLSRGLLEAMLAFIAQANGPSYELRVAAYEFYYPPVLEALKRAAGTGAKIRISYDAGDRKRDGSITLNSTSAANRAAVETLGLRTVPNLTLYPRTMFSKIPHNKFFVLLQNNVPRAIATGSTNITPSGFLGQSNLLHVVRNTELAIRYDQYWQAISKDPPTRPFKRSNTASFPDPLGTLPADSMTAMFSPRRAGLLEWIANEMGNARENVMFTAAFGVAEQLVREFEQDKDFIRFILMERRDREDQARLERDRDTKIAIGSRLNSETIRMKIGGYSLDQWFREEEHYRKRGHIYYIHTKFMLLDALSEMPQIFTGSANFSDPSVTGNDENMLLLKGPRIRSAANIYVNEFMRLFNHLYFRTIAIRLARFRRGDPRKAAILEPDDSWVEKHFRSNTYHDRLRLLFR